MTTVYWIFRDFLSPILSPSPSSLSSSQARRVGVGWKPPRTTEVLIEFIAMLFMRDRERARATERERAREREREAKEGEKDDDDDDDEGLEEKRAKGRHEKTEEEEKGAVHLDVTYRSGSSTSLEYSRLARVPQGQPPSPRRLSKRASQKCRALHVSSLEVSFASSPWRLHRVSANRNYKCLLFLLLTLFRLLLLLLLRASTPASPPLSFSDIVYVSHAQMSNSNLDYPRCPRHLSRC